jgi:hypothetical protein
MPARGERTLLALTHPHLVELPSPADQIVTAVIVDLDCPDMNTDSALVARMLELCGDAEVRINGVDFTAYINELASVRWTMNEEALWEYTLDREPGTSQQNPLSLERHQLVLIGDPRGAISCFTTSSSGAASAQASMWSWRHHHWAYIAVVGLTLVPVLVFLLLYGKDARRRLWLR